MPKELYLKIDDDVARAVAKIQRIGDQEVTLVFPKGSMILSNVINLKLLKKQVELLGKEASILTMDRPGQLRAVEAGFVMATFNRMRNAIPLKEVAPTPSPQIIIPQINPIPSITSIFSKATDFEKDILTQAPKTILESRKPKPLKIKKPTNPRSHWIPVVILAVVLGIVGSLFLLPLATIQITAHTQSLNREMQIIVDKNQRNPDQANLKLPGQIFEIDQEVSKDYDTQGKKDVGVQATGAIQIYNYTGQTLKLNATTTSLIVGSKIYRLQRDVTGIKPTKNTSAANPDPASLIAPVEVIAEGAGESYNLPAGTRVEIQNQILGNVPEKLYAIISTPITGGITRFSAQITQADIDFATADLKLTLINAAREKLAPQNLIILDSSAETEIKSIQFNKSLNDAAVSFRGTIVGHIKALVYEKSALQRVVRGRIELTVDSSQTLGPLEKSKLEASFKSLDLAQGVGTLSVKYQGFLISNINKADIVQLGKGSSPSDLKQILLSDAKIDDVEIDLWPRWARTVPLLPQRIVVQIEND